MNTKRAIPAAALLLASGALLCWGWLAATRGPLPGGTNPVAAEAANRWAPIFDSNVPSSIRLQLAASVDGSFSLAALESWAAAQELRAEGGNMETAFLIYNEVLDQGLRRGIFPTTYGRFLISTVQSSGLDPVFRDYSAQHLAPWVSSYQSGQPSEPDAALRNEAVDVLAQVAADTSLLGLSLSGTALMALADMQEHHPVHLTRHWPALDKVIAEMT